MSDQYGMQYPAAQWGTPEDDFKPPYTQDPPQVPPPYPPYGQPTVGGNQGQAGGSPIVQPVYVPYPVPSSGAEPGDNMALAAMILGIVSAAIGWIPVCGLVALGPAIIGIVLGSLGLKSPRRRGMAIAGIILSVIGIAASTFLFWI
jgi:hypothetical protein